MLKNPLPSFWSEELSKAWAHTDDVIAAAKQSDILLPIARPTAWHADDPERKIKYYVSPQMEREAIVVEEHPFQNSCYVVMEHPATRRRWIRRVY